MFAIRRRDFGEPTLLRLTAQASKKKNACVDVKDRTGAVAAVRELKRLKAREGRVAGILFKCETMQEVRRSRAAQLPVAARSGANSDKTREPA